MNYKEDIVRYRLERAEETYQEALLMQREKHWNTCANWLYYACFYAVSVLLQKHDFLLVFVPDTSFSAFYRRFNINCKSQPYTVQNGCKTLEVRVPFG